jgi:hypothetical protein
MAAQRQTYLKESPGMRPIRIAHRGNTVGPRPEKENRLSYIDDAIASGFNAEIDLWAVGNKLFLGHDGADFEVTLDWLLERDSELWIHCKNPPAIAIMADTNANWFFHNSDDYTLTSRGYLWSFPGREVIGSKCVMLDFSSNLSKDDFSNHPPFAICGDYIADLW